MICRKCGESSLLTPEEKSLRIKAALALAKANGVRVGAPRKVNYDEVRRLYQSGKSIRGIARILNTSNGSIQYAVRMIK